MKQDGMEMYFNMEKNNFYLFKIIKHILFSRI